MQHMHYPENSTGRSYGNVPNHTPWGNGERAVCHVCRKAIRFVEGYELRRDYWRLVSGREAVTA